MFELVNPPGVATKFGVVTPNATHSPEVGIPPVVFRFPAGVRYITPAVEFVHVLTKKIAPAGMARFIGSERMLDPFAAVPWLLPPNVPIAAIVPAGYSILN